jgi:uncharacterized protein (DUF433 family)
MYQGDQVMEKGRIILDANVHFGKPCIAGTRIKVEDVLELVEEGIPFAEIVDRYYTDLSIDDIKVCVRYALDIITSEEIHIREAG